MKHIHLNEKDSTPVDYEMSVPEQTLRDLICITEDSIKALAGQMDSMAKDMKAMRGTMETQFPAIVDKLQELIQCMDRNTDKGIAKTDELLEAMKEE
jgi:hypothetical protein